MIRPKSLFPQRHSKGTQRRVVTREEAMQLGETILDLVRSRSLGITLEHRSTVVTTVANGSVLSSEDTDTFTFQFWTRFGSGVPVIIESSLRDVDALRRVVREAEVVSTPMLEIEDRDEDDPDDPIRHSYAKREFLPVSLWHDTTARAMDTAAGDVVPSMVEAMRASQLVGAATVALSARSVLYMYRPGLTAWGEQTDAEVTVTARTPDGKVSGWSGQAHRDWSKIDPQRVVQEANGFLSYGRTPYAIEPGRRTAILGPAAVAQLMRAMVPFFEARRIDGGQTPFSVAESPEGRLNRLGQRVFDPRVSMSTDPTDPENGDQPFFDEPYAAVGGFPSPKVDWIKDGVLNALAYDVFYSLERGKTACKLPWAVRMSGGPATIDSMIASCEEGVYVNRFSDIEVSDRNSGMMTGVTRDGCFLVKRGKIVSPIKNFRFDESPFFVFNSIHQLGAPQRAAFGYNPGQQRYRQAWPLAPVVVPPMMVRDFNFSALIDAV